MLCNNCGELCEKQGVDFLGNWSCENCGLVDEDAYKEDKIWDDPYWCNSEYYEDE